MKVYLSNKLMVKAVNEEEAIAYVGLKAMFDKMLSKDRDEVVANFNVANLFYEVSGSLELNKTDKTKLEKGINDLINAGIVNLITADGKGNYVLDIAGLYVERDYNVMTQDEIWSIFNLPCKQKFNLLRFGIGLFSTFNNSDNAGYCSFRKMPDYTGVNRIASCQSYFKLLEEHEIIYVRHSNVAKRDTDGSYKNLVNVYGRPSHKQDVDAKYNSNVMAQGYDFTKTMDSDERRKVTLAYNKFLKDKYTGDVKELIKMCLAYNEQPKYEENDWCKDMSVFSPELVAEVEAELDAQAETKREARQEAKANHKAKAKAKAKAEPTKAKANATQAKAEPKQWASLLEGCKKLNAQIAKQQPEDELDELAELIAVPKASKPVVDDWDDWDELVAMPTPKAKYIVPDELSWD